MTRTIRYLNTVWSFFGFIVLTWLAIASPIYIVHFGFFTWCFSAFLLLLLITPAGGIVLGEREKRLSLFEWLGKIVTANVMLCVLTLTVHDAFLSAGPEFAIGSLTYAFTKEVVSGYTLTHWGIFPWGVYGCWGLVVAYYAFVKQGSPYLYQSGGGLSLRLQAMFKTYVETACTIATLSVVALSVSALLLLALYAVYIQIQLHHFMIPIISVMLISMLISFFSFRWGKRLFKRMAQRQFGIQRIVVMFIVIMLPLMLAVSFINGSIAASVPAILEQSKCHTCGTIFNLVPPDTRFASLYWGWFMLWAPLGGSYLASISQGRTIREFVLGVMTVPLVLAISFIFISESDVKAFLTLMNRQEFKPLLYLGLAGLSFVFLTILLVNKRDNSILLSGFFPVAEVFKRDRLKVSNASKISGISKFGHTLMNTMIMIVVIHTLAGWYMIQFQVAAIAAIVVHVLYFAGIFLIAQMFRDKAWIGNKNIAPLNTAHTHQNKKRRRR